MNYGQIIAGYIKLRDKRDELKKKHAEELKPFTEMMAKIEGKLLEQFNEEGSDGTKTPFGSAFKSERSTLKVTDWNITLPWIVENERWDMLEARVGKEAALAHLKETGEDVPGTEVSKEWVVGVRRPSSKKK